MGKPDQHNTYASHTSLCMLGIRFLWAVPYVATFNDSSTDLDGSHCSCEKGFPTQSIACRLTDPWVHTHFLSQVNQWSNRLKPSFCRWQATKLTGPIPPTCDRYVQYLLAGANPSVLNWDRRGLQPWRCRLSTYHSPTFPTSCLPFPPQGLARSLVYPKSIN
jgi:hypothetical protein